VAAAWIDVVCAAQSEQVFRIGAQSLELVAHLLHASAESVARLVQRLDSSASREADPALAQAVFRVVTRNASAGGSAEAWAGLFGFALDEDAPAGVAWMADVCAATAATAARQALPVDRLLVLYDSAFKVDVDALNRVCACALAARAELGDFGQRAKTELVPRLLATAGAEDLLAVVLFEALTNDDGKASASLAECMGMDL
jgi:hypothetical protein